MKLLWTHYLRGAQFLLGALVLALAIASAATFYVPGFYPSQSAFLAFDGVWTILVVLYFLLAHRVAPVTTHPIARVILDAVTCIFWFAGFIALAVAVAASAPVVGNIPGANPDGNPGLNGNGNQCTGDDGTNYCNNNQGYFSSRPNTWFQVSATAAAFGGVEWALFAATTTVTATEAHRSHWKHSSTPMSENPGDRPATV